MVVRLATPEDARAIASIQVRAWQSAYHGIVPEAYLRSLSVADREAAWETILRESRSATYVAARGPETVGWISIGKSRDPDAAPGDGELWAIYVAPEQWGAGAGRALWQRGESHLQDFGFRDVTVWVFKDNRRARTFYESAGFATHPEQEKLLELGGAQLPEVRLRRPFGAGARPRGPDEGPRPSG